MKRVNLSLGNLYPRKYRESVAELLRYGGGNTNATGWLGSAILINLLSIVLIITFLSDINTQTFDIFYILLFSFAITIIIQSLFYIVPYYSAERRAKEVEAVLPSFYQLVASYLRSGMTPFQALKLASRDEFGVLKDELDAATSKAFGTQSFSDALLALSSHIRSENLQRSTELMVRGLESGGSLAKMLEESAANLIENRSLKRQLIAATRTYTLMVIFAVIVGTPLLLSVSTRFNERLMDLSESIQIDASNVKGLEMGMLSGDLSINPEHLYYIAVFMIFMTSLISSFLVGIIAEGKEKYGVKYAAMFIPVSLILFFVFKEVMRSFF